jgi:hypothetical protein
MRWLLGLVFFWSACHAHISDIRGWEHTFINETLLSQGLIFEIMNDHLDAIKCVEGNKVYLKADYLQPSEQGMMLVCDGSSALLLPQLYSDQYGCYIKSSMLCTSCGIDLPQEIGPCER